MPEDAQIIKVYNCSRFLRKALGLRPQLDSVLGARGGTGGGGGGGKEGRGGGGGCSNTKLNHKTIALLNI